MKAFRRFGGSGLCAAAFLFAGCAYAAEWVHIGEEDYIAGAKITSPVKLQNRVVLVDEWGVNCPPCRALLPRIQEIWTTYGLPANKPLVVIGSHRQGRDDERIHALVQKHGLTYPIYQGAGLAAGEPSNGGAIPFLYVLNHRGKVVYRGRNDRDAIEAIVNALGEVGKLPSLTEGVSLAKYKNLEKQLVLGKPIKALVTRLTADAKSKNPAVAGEAEALLKAIDRGLARTKEEIDYQKTVDPKEALRLIKLMKTTWPKESEVYKPDVPGLIKAMKQQTAGAK